MLFEKTEEIHLNKLQNCLLEAISEGTVHAEEICEFIKTKLNRNVTPHWVSNNVRLITPRLLRIGYGIRRTSPLGRSVLGSYELVEFKVKKP